MLFDTDLPGFRLAHSRARNGPSSCTTGREGGGTCTRWEVFGPLTPDDARGSSQSRNWASTRKGMTLWRRGGPAGPFQRSRLWADEYLEGVKQREKRPAGRRAIPHVGKAAMGRTDPSTRSRPADVEKTFQLLGF